jgi:hypothetical protein
VDHFSLGDPDSVSKRVLLEGLGLSTLCYVQNYDLTRRLAPSVPADLGQWDSPWELFLSAAERISELLELCGGCD